MPVFSISNAFGVRFAVIGFLALTAFASCTVITPHERANAPIDPLPKDYQAQIKNFEVGRLKDPYSAVYRFGTPQRGYWQDGLVHGGGKHFGYIVPVGINAKNSYGGYTGEEIQYIAFERGRVAGDVTILWGQMAGFL